MQNELSSYYLRVADDYRERYLEAERLMIQAREAATREVEEAVEKVERRLTKQLEDQASSFEQRLSAKEAECTRLQ